MRSSRPIDSWVPTSIEQVVFADEGFTTVEARSTIELQDGHAWKLREGRRESVIARVSGDTIRFERVAPGRGGFTWIRVTPDEWRAVLDRPRGRDPIVYTLRRSPTDATPHPGGR